MLKPLLTASAVLVLAAAGFAAPTPAKPTVKPVALICPVTGEKIASVKAAVGSSVYKGKKYYFCCDSCKPMFDKDPQKYAKPTAH